MSLKQHQIYMLKTHQLYLIIMHRRLLTRGFSYLKGRSQRGLNQSKSFNQGQTFRDKKFFRKQELAKIDLSKVGLNHLPDTEDLKQVPQLKHGLDKFLNSELVFDDHGVGKLPNDEQSKKSTIKEVTSYIEPSKDKTLLEKGVQNKARYVSSTSNISGPLVCLYFIFSRFRGPNTDNIYENLSSKPQNWIISMRKPTSFYLHKIAQNCDSISSDKGLLPAKHQVLMDLGHLIQYLLTHQTQQTRKLLSGEKVEKLVNYYRYVKVNDQILLRSQIDCRSYDKNGDPFVFEIKSRACAPIRYDIENYKDYKDYDINSVRGTYESFQREYFDLIRSGFMKYAMQIKIGKMNGAFIAYHNTQKIYGYQYVNIKEMALRIFGDQYNLDVSFLCISKMMTIVLNHIRQNLAQHKNDTLKVGFYAEQKYRKLVVIIQGMSVCKQYRALSEQQSKQITSIYDYYTKHTKLVNPVYKFQFDFQILINGLITNNSQILLTPHDSLEIRYKVSPRMHVSLMQYIVFLNECYKNEEVYCSYLYRGHWNINE